MNLKCVTGDTTLVTALRHQHEQVVPLLVECKADVNVPGARGESPLFVAVGFDLNDAVKFLILSDADLSYFGNVSRTALCQALRCHVSSDTLKTLLVSKADLNVCEGCVHELQDDQDVVAPWALWKDPRQCRALGDPPVLLAAKGGDPALLQTLLDFEADPGDTDEAECTPLMSVAALGHSESFEVLRPSLRDTEVKKRDLFGWTARLHAAARGTLEASEVLGEWWQRANNSPMLRRTMTSLQRPNRRASMEPMAVEGGPADLEDQVAELDHTTELEHTTELD